MKVGVIGAGNWGKNLVRTFYHLGALAGVAEVNPDLRLKIQEQYPETPVYDNLQPLLDTGIPAVAIATPVQTHYQLTREALLAGKDVFVEKPLTLSTKDAADLVALAEKTGKILMVGHLLLYQPAIQWLKASIASGAIGQIASLSQERLKLGRVRRVENVLWSFGVHDVAVLLYLVGQAPNSVDAAGQSFLQPHIEDDVYLHLCFPGEVKAHLHVSWLWPEQRRTLTIVGSEGMLVYNELEQKVTLHKKQVTRNLEQIDQGSEVVFEGDAEPLLQECGHFLECIIERKKPLSHGASAVEVIEVLEKAEQLLKGEKA